MDNEPFYPQLLDHYTQLIQSGPEIQGDDYNSAHLLWMIDQLRTEAMSLTKKHRWLGFIQGVVIVHGLTQVSQERDFTRAIFAGA